MSTTVLAIPEETASGLRQAAVEMGVSAEELAEKAIRRYLRQEAERKIDREEIVYWSQHKELLERFGGRYIAMHKGEVIDSDDDEIALYVRAQRKHPTVGILIKKVGSGEDVWTPTITACGVRLMALYTYEYDQTYEPAMPIAPVWVISPVTGRTAGPFSILIDSGSDGTLIPVDILEQIGALSIGSGRLRWLWQESRSVNIYVVRLTLGPYRLPGVRVAGVPGGTDFILGRNVLNHISLTLNGPAESIEIPHP